MTWRDAALTLVSLVHMCHRDVDTPARIEGHRGYGPGDKRLKILFKTSNFKFTTLTGNSSSHAFCAFLLLYYQTISFRVLTSNSLKFEMNVLCPYDFGNMTNRMEILMLR